MRSPRSAFSAKRDGGATVLKENIDLCAVISETLRDFEIRAADAGVHINIHRPETVMMTGNAGLLLSVFHNLLDNAFAYSGCSTVDINVDNSDEDYVTVSFDLRRVKTNSSPSGIRFSTETMPPCIATAFLTMARPRPVPPALRDRPLSTR